MKNLMIVLLLTVVSLKVSAEETLLNLAKNRPVRSDSVYQEYSPAKAVDGIVSDPSRWLSANTAGPHWLEIDLGAPQLLGSAHVFSGYEDSDSVSAFEFQIPASKGWETVPGSKVSANTKNARSVVFSQPIETKRIRLVIAGDGIARIREVALFPPSEKGSPPLGVGLQIQLETTVIVEAMPVLVNQSGYDLNWPKRFTAPLAPDRSPFVVKAVGSEVPLFKGQIANSVGDFSDFRPKGKETEYVIEVRSPDGHIGQSVPFRIQPDWMRSVCFDPALRFMIDTRSVTGTHPSAYGGSPWRDGTYYSFEVPSLVMLYLSNPTFFDNLPVEIDYSVDRIRILNPHFKLIKARHDEKALATARRYYQELDPPASPETPDIIQLIHWGIGWYLLDPQTHDPSRDPLGDQIHAQTVEQFAFFLYGFPAWKEHFTERFYGQARDFAFRHWETVGLFDVIETIGTFKGRHCPGHSIMPNLMMAEVARREGRPTADVERFETAATAQAQWIVENCSPADPLVTKGQRMSEHKLITGLVMLQGDYPRLAPDGLQEWLEKWADVVVERSANGYDFRRYDANNWTLPRFTADSHGGAGWNEPGNLAAFPGLCFAVASLIDDPNDSKRLAEIGVAHFDNLFGRNPVSAHSSAKAPEFFPGVERGWPKHFPDDVTARLELCRGALSSSAASEHYPYHPLGEFRHPEGWVAFNAAFNVGLAWTEWHTTGKRPSHTPRPQ